MASRTSTSVGMGITVTLMGVMLLATFILAIVFYGQKQKFQRELADLRLKQAAVIAPGEENTDRVTELIRDASSAPGGRRTLVSHLDQSLQTAMYRITGSRNQSMDGLQAQLQRIEGAGNTSLISLIDQRNAQIARLEKSIADAESARAAAEADLQAEVDRVERIQQDRAETLAALNEEIGRYKTELDRYRSMVHSTIDENNGRVDQIRSMASQVETGLRERIAQYDEKAILQQAVIDQLRRERASEVLRPTDEFALVDATIVGTEGAQRQAFIDVGRSNRVVLGMSFEVYSNAAAIRADADGNYPPGKATLEVIRIDENSSVCRIVRENRGNPIVVGDVVANAVYDPNKQYEFVVFGNFDSNRDGISTPQERNAIVSMVDGWGGKVSEELTGRTDFLVLGDQPILPPTPAPDAPIVVIQEYIRKQRDRQTYDELFRTATQTGIPILNENRLYTLTGHQGAGG